MAPTVFFPTTAKSLNLRAGFDLRRQLQNQWCPTKACLNLAESTEACPRFPRTWTVRQTQLGFNKRIAITSPLLLSAANNARAKMPVTRSRIKFGC